MNHYPAIGWYGKLPSAGDFLQRRFPEVLLRQWSHWFQVGLHAWQQEGELNQEVTRQFSRAPVWNFVVPPILDSQFIQVGCLLPARDSVGRQYPVCALCRFTEAEWSPQRLSMSGEWFNVLGRTLLHGVRAHYTAEQLDQALTAIPAPPDPASERRSDILDIIGYGDNINTLGWQQVADSFAPQRHTSFWWTNQADGYPLYTHIHSGNFTGQLFSLLFHPAGGKNPGRHGLYPPMFE